MALVKSIVRWKHILKYGPHFLVYTDASSLKYIVRIKSDENIFQHWFADLAQYKFIEIHKKEIKNVSVDALSRSDSLDVPTKEENEEYQTDNELGELKLTYATDLEGDPAEIVKERRRLAGFWPAESRNKT